MSQYAVITHSYTTQAIDQPPVDRQEIIGTVAQRLGETDDAFTARVKAVMAGLEAKVYENETGLKAVLNGKPVYDGVIGHEVVGDLDPEPEPVAIRDRLARLGKMMHSVKGTRFTWFRHFAEEVSLGKSGRGRNAFPVIRVKLVFPADDLLSVPADQFDAHAFLDHRELKVLPILMLIPMDGYEWPDPEPEED